MRTCVLKKISSVITQQVKKAMGAASSMSFDMVCTSYEKVDDTPLLRAAEGVM